MRQITLSDEDAQQVRAILMTHAEMQDRCAIANEELRGQLSRADGNEGMIGDLQETHEVISDDSNNLKRIADIFQ